MSDAKEKYRARIAALVRENPDDEKFCDELEAIVADMADDSLNRKFAESFRSNLQRIRDDIWRVDQLNKVLKKMFGELSGGACECEVRKYESHPGYRAFMVGDSCFYSISPKTEAAIFPAKAWGGSYGEKVVRSFDEFVDYLWKNAAWLPAEQEIRDVRLRSRRDEECRAFQAAARERRRAFWRALLRMLLPRRSES